MSPEIVASSRPAKAGVVGRHALSCALLAIITFQVTALKYLLNALMVSRILNLTLFIGAVALGGIVIFHDRHVRRVWISYLLPALLAAAACSANLLVAVASRASVSNQLGLILVMASVISVVFFHKRGLVDRERLWRLYFNVMVLLVALGLIEYALIWSGGYSPRPIQTDGGMYVGGRVSLLYETEQGLLHARFYGAFPEPGTLAMWALPALAYGVVRRRFVGVTLLSVGFFLTRSLGGIISLVILGGALLVASARRTRIALLLLPVVVIGLVWFGVEFTNNYAAAAVQTRGAASLTVRVDNVVGLLANLPSVVAQAPFGIQRATTTEELVGNPLVFGTTFAVSNVFLQGGLLAVVGFLVLVVQSAFFAQSVILRRHADQIDFVCAVSIIALLPFLVQRSTVWESSLFAVLFAPSLLAYLERRPRTIGPDGG